MRTRRGISIALVLAVAAIALTAALTAGSMATSHLHLVQTYVNGQDGMYLAEAAIAEALSQVHANHAWGTNATDEIRVQPDPANPQRYGLITFNTTGPDPWSTNNFDSKHNLGWQDKVVPGQSMRLVAVGISGQARHVIEAMVSVPPFPYVLAVDGPMTCNGTLKVGAASSQGDFVQSTLNNEAVDGAASVASNNSIALQQTVSISGDVVCPGAISLPADAQVGGQLIHDSAEMPDMNMTTLDPSGDLGVDRIDNASSGPMLNVAAAHYTAGSLQVNGDLTLDGGLLYVNGDLVVTGSLSGRGVVVVRGKTFIEQGADLSATNLTALLSEGDVTLSSPSAQKYFQGLVYTQGVFTASNLTIVGAFVAASTQGEPTAIHLQNVTAIWTPDAADAMIQVQGAELKVGVGNTVKKIVSGYIATKSTMVQTHKRNVLTKVGSDPVAQAAQKVVDAYANQVDLIFGNDRGNGALNWAPPPNMAMINNLLNRRNDLGATLNLAYSKISPHAIVAVRTQDQIQFNSDDGLYHLAAAPADATVRAWLGTIHPTGNITWTPYFINVVSANGVTTATYVYDIPKTTTLPGKFSSVNLARIAHHIQIGAQKWVDAVNSMATTLTSTSANTVINLNLNRFLKDSMPLRIMSWRDGIW